MPDAAAPWWASSGMRRFIVALLLLLAAWVVVVRAWNVDETQDRELILGAAITIVSTVVGYYFGSRGVESAQEIADVAKERRFEAKAGGEEATRLLGEYEALLETAQKELDEASRVAKEYADLREAADAETRRKLDELVRQVRSRTP